MSDLDLDKVKQEITDFILSMPSDFTWLPRQYILVDGQPLEEPNALKYSRWASDIRNRRIALDYTWHGVEVSTVFLGTDHNYLGYGPPILFETMVFGGKLDHKQVRYTNVEAARTGHVLMLIAAENAAGPVRRKRLKKKLWKKWCARRQAAETPAK